MSRLLLFLLILFPAVLSGQERQRAILDSIKLSAADLQKVSDVIGNTPGTTIEDIKASGSDGSITVTVRIHVTEAMQVHGLSSVPVAAMKTRSIGADKMATITVPPPPFLKEADTILALSSLPPTTVKIDDIVTNLVTVLAVPPPPFLKEVDTILALSSLPPTTVKVDDIAAGLVTALTVPPAPNIIIADSISALSLIVVSNIRIEAAPATAMNLVIVPPAPKIKDDVTTLLLSAINQFKIENTPPSNLDNIEVPPLPYIIGDIEAVPVLSVIPCSIKQSTAVGMTTRAVPAIPDIQTDDMLALIAAVQLATPRSTAHRMEMTPFPDFGTDEVTVAGMHLSADGYALLEKMEGFSPELYALGDGGCTIGFGFFVPYAEIGKWRKGITWEDAERLIRQKVPTYEDQVKQYINVPLIQEEFDALTMLAYNLGGFSRATSIVNDINNNADFDKLQHDWMRFVHSKAPNVMKGLLNRRHDEMEVRRESNYQPERKILVYKNKKG